MQSDESVAHYAKSTNASNQKAKGAFQFDLMDNDLALRGDSEKSSLPMSPILTAAQDSISKGLTMDSISRDSTIKGW
jgi:hypothetical protein